MNPLREYDISGTMPDLLRGRECVLDVGCGEGHQLKVLQQAGSRVVGLEYALRQARVCSGKGLPVVCGAAERLPFPPRTFDGLLCNVVVPYTDERLTIREWARVLKPGGTAVACFHGPGYPLRQLLGSKGLKTVLYGGRTIANTLFYRLTGNRLPGFVGDTLYQSRASLRRYYRECGLHLQREVRSRRFLGRSVFILHELIRAP